MKISDRVRELRITKNLTQQEFADKLRIKRSTISNYDIGRSEPSESVISLICRTFSVSETWLRTGEGEMFSDTAREEQIAAFMGDVLAAESEDFRKRFVSMLSSLSVDEWRLIEEKAKELVEKEQEIGLSYTIFLYKGERIVQALPFSNTYPII